MNELVCIWRNVMVLIRDALVLDSTCIRVVGLPAIFTSFDGLRVLCVNPITAETLYVLCSWLKGELWKVLKVVGIDNGEIVV
jgi:hypothetical protein